MRKQIILFIAALMSIGGAMCPMYGTNSFASSDQEENMRAEWDLIELYINQHPGRQVLLTGSIGSYPIHMYLNADLSGYYYYDSRPNNHFRLRLSRRGDVVDEFTAPIYYYGGGTIELQEFSPSGNNSGEFVADLYLNKFREPYGENAPAYHSYLLDFGGTFRNKSNGKEFEVSLSSDFFALSADLIRSLSEKPEEDEPIFVVVEHMPLFPGGEEAMRKYIQENIQYPQEAKDAGIQGRAICQFVINADGSISDIVIVRSAGDKSLDKEAVRVIQSMPKWIPGMQNEKKVRVKYTIPISFR